MLDFKTPSNETRFCRLLGNIYLPALISITLYKGEMVLGLILIFMFIVSILPEYTLYLLLFKSNRATKVFLRTTVLLTTSNVFFIILLNTDEEFSGMWMIMLLVSLSYSTWFGYMNAKGLYADNKELLDEYYARRFS